MMAEHQKQEALSSGDPSSESHSANPNTMIGTSIEDYTQLFVHLFNIGHMLYGQTHEVADRLCHEVAVGTQERARLLLHYGHLTGETHEAFPLIAVSFPIQHHNRAYGTLCVAPDPLQPALPALPLPIAHLLAQVCSWLLYSLELAALLDGKYQLTDRQVSHSLTKRQHEVLLLMCRGYDQWAISQMLSTSPATIRKHRQSIYEHLHVHNVQEAIIKAYQTGLYFPLEDIEPV